MPMDRGFTLVEMAVVLVVIGLVMLTIFPALTLLRSSSQRNLTQTNLQALMQSTAAYVQANGCLPCPTPANVANSAPAGFGHVRGDSSISPAACGGCTILEGIPPYGSLGLPVSTAHDGWGHWITMRVDQALTVNFGIVPPTAACQASDLPPNTVTPTCITQGASQKGLCRTGLSTSNRIIVQMPNGTVTPGTQQAAVIFVSHGVSGFGSFYAMTGPDLNNGSRIPFPSSVPACSATGGFTRCNADNNTIFVNALLSQASNDPYDDVLAFTDRNSLVSQFGNGSCQTVW